MNLDDFHIGSLLMQSQRQFDAYFFLAGELLVDLFSPLQDNRFADIIL